MLDVAGPGLQLLGGGLDRQEVAADAGVLVAATAAVGAHAVPKLDAALAECSQNAVSAAAVGLRHSAAGRWARRQATLSGTAVVGWA
jgi:hypothetical protein